MPDPELHRTLRRQLSRAGIPLEEITDERYRALLSRVSSAYDEAEKQRYLHDRAFLLASSEMQTLYDRLEEASQSAAAVQRDRLRAVFDTAATGLVVLDDDSTILDVNEVAESVLGLSQRAAAGKPLGSLLMSHTGSDQALAELHHAIARGRNWRSPDTAVTTVAGTTFSAALFYRAMATGGGVLAIEDITERKEAQAELLWRANHDQLTGLLNRAAFMDRVQRALHRARRYGHRLSVMFLDLDKFKRVNDTLGHAAGDALLIECSQRINSVMRDVDTVARLGGDEFVVVCENLSGEPEARQIAGRLVEVIGKPFEIGDDVAFVDASIGLAIADGRGTDPDKLLRDADVALYEAKEVTGPAIIVYREAMITRMQHALDLERRIRRGLIDDEFWVAYQPIFRVPGRTFIGYEALARWTSQGEQIPPAEFIPAAESAALLDEVGRRVIGQALHFLSTCPAGTLMFLNIAPSQLAAQGFVDWLASMLTSTRTDPHDIFLEITDMDGVSDYELSPVLNDLRDHGVRVALDDFGVGHSSLASLNTLPIDLIKMDRSFLADAQANARSGQIARMLCDLGRSLGIEVIAEGVESPDQLRILADIGCDIGQGYLFGRPAPADDAVIHLS